MRYVVTIILLLLSVCGLYAQQTEQDYYLYKIDSEREEVDMVDSDTTLFYRLVRRDGDLYAKITDYRFSYVSTARRGFDFYERGVWLDGITMQSGDVNILRRLGLVEYRAAGISPNENVASVAAGSDNFSLRHYAPSSALNVGTFFSGRGYLGGVRATLHSAINRGWGLSLHALARGGDDLYVGGVFNNSVDFGLRLSKDFLSGANLSLLVLSKVGERGLHSGSVDEVFTLTGDNLYNPNWGRQNGEVRNSRVRRDCLPFAMIAFSADIGRATKMTLSLGGRYGEQSYSSLAWYGAMTPRPDNYRYLPSYYADAEVASAVADEWRRGNERYTQIDWAELYYQNSMSSRGAVYTIEERVERVARGEFSLRFQSEIGKGLTASYGIRGFYNSSRNFKRMGDLLGAAYLDDIDYYLLDDDTFSRNLQNNLQNPNRRIGEGDKFSYDYLLAEIAYMADAAIEYRVAKWVMNASINIANHSFYRRGFYEKEIFAGDKSFGRSRKVGFAPYVFKASIGYNFSPSNILDASVMTARRCAEVEDLFLNAEYNNQIVDKPTPESHLAAELNYKHLSQNFNLTFTAYMASVEGQMQTFRAYDDLSAEYCDVVVSGLGTMRYGVELAGEIKLSKHLTASVAASAGRYIYSKNPLISHYADVDNSIISKESKSYVGECTIGGAPQLSGLVGVNYLNYRGWAASCSVQGVAQRYADVSFVRRTERVARQASASEEIYRQFMNQERLGDAVSVDASLSKWFNIGRTRLSLTVSVRNLLGNENIVYGAYEQSRIKNFVSASQRVYAPQPNIMTYAYPRTWYGVLSWKF